MTQEEMKQKMRAIKFRGKRIDEPHQWEYGYIQIDGKDVWMHTIDGRVILVIPETVGQFAGLVDKNSKEIYEGDIVEHPYIDPIFGDLVEIKDGNGVKSVVVFHEGAFCVRYGEDVFYYLDQFTRHKHIEVDGNVFDNPELLKGG